MSNTQAMPRLTQAVLDRQGCGNPDCDHDHSVIYFHSACHPTAQVEVAYHKQTGTLRLKCGKCRKFMAEIQVAPL